MEKQPKYQDKILKFLPKASSSVSFHQKLPFSPNKDNNKRFSGPIMVPMIPHEARIRRKKTKNNNNNNNNGFDSPQEDELADNKDPTSPKISCMGQIKQKTTKKKRVVVAAEAKETKPGLTWSPRDVKKQASAIKRMLSSVVAKPGRKSSASASSLSLVDHHHHDDDDHDCDRYSTSMSDGAPSLSQMKRFASGRDRLASFDWAVAQVAPVDADHRNIHDDDDVRIPFSAPLGIIKTGGNDSNNTYQIPLNPRKEINLWKRRTMAPPRPLDLNNITIRAN